MRSQEARKDREESEETERSRAAKSERTRLELALSSTAVGEEEEGELAPLPSASRKANLASADFSCRPKRLKRRLLRMDGLAGGGR